MTTLSHPMGLIDVGEVPAGRKGLHWMVQHRLKRLFLRIAQDSIIRAPDHMQRLGWQGISTSSETTTAGKRRQRLSPAGALQMQRSDLLFRRSHIRIGISKRLATQAPTNARMPQEPCTEAIKQRWNGHGAPGEARRCQKQQRAHALWVKPGQFHSNGATHRGTDQTKGTTRGQPLEQGIKVP